MTFDGYSKKDPNARQEINAALYPHTSWDTMVIEGLPSKVMSGCSHFLPTSQTF
jgi:hypothetical protein